MTLKHSPIAKADLHSNDDFSVQILMTTSKNVFRTENNSLM